MVGPVWKSEGNTFFMIGIQKDRFTRCSAGLSPTKLSPTKIQQAMQEQEQCYMLLYKWKQQI